MPHTDATLSDYVNTLESLRPETRELVGLTLASTSKEFPDYSFDVMEDFPTYKYLVLGLRSPCPLALLVRLSELKLGPYGEGMLVSRDGSNIMYLMFRKQQDDEN